MRRALVVAAGVLALLVVAQIGLPPLAEHRLRGTLEDDGRVERVEVRAFPAVKLLWHRADRVEVRMSESRAGTGRLADLLARTDATDRLDASLETFDLGPLRLRDVTLRKRGARLVGAASVRDGDLRAALPEGVDVRPVASGGGELVFEGTADVFGAHVTARARLLAEDGALRIQPDVALGGFLSVTAFSDPRVVVESVGARTAPGGFRVEARGRLR